MTNKGVFKRPAIQPVCSGTGLIALDMVMGSTNEDTPKLWAGGSCANVMTILSYLGWRSHPIARISNDLAASEVLNDLRRWRVRTKLIGREKSGGTPVIVQKIFTNRQGILRHRFEWTCPYCGSWFPAFRPVLAQDVEDISRDMPWSNVFYFDRVSRSAVDLARISRARGALIVFEPNSFKDSKLLQECLNLADIVKYSHDRFADGKNLTDKIRVPLEIETFGSNGLKYRCSIIPNERRTWKRMDPFTVHDLKDSVGSGDWCTAGIIHILGKFGRAGFENIGPEHITHAIKFGQALATLNCYYEGARGIMYNLKKTTFKRLIREIFDGQSPSSGLIDQISNISIDRFKCGDLCPT